MLFVLHLFASLYIIFSSGPHIKTMKAYIYDGKPYVLSASDQLSSDFASIVETNVSLTTPASTSRNPPLPNSASSIGAYPSILKAFGNPRLTSLQRSEATKTGIELLSLGKGWERPMRKKSSRSLTSALFTFLSRLLLL